MCLQWGAEYRECCPQSCSSQLCGSELFTVDFMSLCSSEVSLLVHCIATLSDGEWVVGGCADDVPFALLRLVKLFTLGHARRQWPITLQSPVAQLRNTQQCSQTQTLPHNSADGSNTIKTAAVTQESHSATTTVGSNGAVAGCATTHCTTVPADTDTAAPLLCNVDKSITIKCFARTVRSNTVKCLCRTLLTIPTNCDKHKSERLDIVSRVWKQTSDL